MEWVALVASMQCSELNGSYMTPAHPFDIGPINFYHYTQYGILDRHMVPGSLGLVVGNFNSRNRKEDHLWTLVPR